MLALIEVKKYAQRFDCADDVIRLRGLGPILGLQAGFMVAHVQNGNPKEVQRSVKELLDDIKGDTKAVVRASDISFSDGHDNYHCAAVVADVFP